MCSCDLASRSCRLRKWMLAKLKIRNKRRRTSTHNKLKLHTPVKNRKIWCYTATGVQRPYINVDKLPYGPKARDAKSADYTVLKTEPSKLQKVVLNTFILTSSRRFQMPQDCTIDIWDSLLKMDGRNTTSYNSWFDYSWSITDLWISGHPYDGIEYSIWVTFFSRTFSIELVHGTGSSTIVQVKSSHTPALNFFGKILRLNSFLIIH